MAVVKNWTAAAIEGVGAAASNADVVSRPAQVRRFADGSATDWCKHYAPSFCKYVRIKNQGSGDLDVSWGPALEGARGATQHRATLGTGEQLGISFAGQAPERESYTTFSTWGADGAAHDIEIGFEAVP